MSGKKMTVWNIYDKTFLSLTLKTNAETRNICFHGTEIKLEEIMDQFTPEDAIYAR